ncbi:hypothetical protein [Lentilactobacillus hilgardii]|uniref:hypothetical protein n=1 Tax=Lentilactobacillus hilgardii TaxID=1588 RepID=UPI0021C3B85C|nr:hypothetical protein [Lentilactobacillus hilgardii]MCP9334420.1 hypothetical protein [Lentilactobacillus hilgardii]MCP9351009.1 hypothetical protein [Lentilactobacillus hilgardii]MCP9353530.1 hypothetical protein [Lentilactobacillus hilgardii]
MTGVKNVLYINDYGYTFTNPHDFSYLEAFYGSKDTSKSLFIDGNTLDQYVGKSLIKSYQLEPVTREAYKPLYYEPSVIINDDKVREYLYNYRDTLGKSIPADYKLIKLATNAAKPSTQLTPDPKTSSDNGFAEMMDFWSGYSMSGIFNGHKW